MGVVSIEEQPDASVGASPAGTHPALRGLYDAHVGAALGLAQSLLRDRAAAEDVAHEAFVRLDRALRGKALQNPRAYLLSTVRNVALKELRRRSRESKAKQGLGASADASSEPGPDRSSLVQRALAQLAPDLRAVLLLRHVHELPYAELTGTLELSERTIRNRLRTAAVLFARHLRRLEAEEDA